MRLAKVMMLLSVVLAFGAVTLLARVCPVTGQLATDSYFADVDGKRVYFSCELARKDFLAGPEQYLEKLNIVSNAKKKAQEICPVSNEAINRSIWADYNGKRVYLHCKPAQTKFLKNPEVYYNKLIEGNIALENTPALDLRFVVASEGAGLAN
ncbi:MAG: hypothetical protein HOC20_09000 [Chloroflexi bacterium]|jgi:YHS domain-containing protein|nr:hypothetical protein [Chloroflexota bacterium]